MSDRSLRFVAALCVVALAAGIGCSSGAPAKEEAKPAFQDPAAQEPGTAAPAASPETQRAVQVQASTPEMEKIAQELARGRSATTSRRSCSTTRAISTRPRSRLSPPSRPGTRTSQPANS